MAGFDIIALDGNDAVICGDNRIIISEFNYRITRKLFKCFEAALVIVHVVRHSGVNDPLQSGRGGSDSMSSQSEKVTVSGCSESCCRSSFLGSPALCHTFVGDTINFDMAW
jgi:hypothetical protein